VNVVSADEAEKFVESVRREYARVMKIEADCFICEPSDGALALAAKGGAA
jgi:galactokinase